MNNEGKVFSMDVESNGLYGQGFAIGAVVTLPGQEPITYVARCPIIGETNEWVAENVLPHIKDIEQTHESYTSMLEGFFDFYQEHKKDSDVIAHMGHPVETKVLRDIIELNLESRIFEGPFPFIDVSSVLKAKGFDPTSVDGYNQSQGLTVPFGGKTHHPLYDSWAAEVVYRDLMK